LEEVIAELDESGNSPVVLLRNAPVVSPFTHICATASSALGTSPRGQEEYAQALAVA
jgi:hypothetical protein